MDAVAMNYTQLARESSSPKPKLPVCPHPATMWQLYEGTLIECAVCGKREMMDVRNLPDFWECTPCTAEQILRHAHESTKGT
jgi:hypothetical protein